MAHQWKRMICMVMSLCLTFGGTVWAEPLQTPSDGSAIETVSQQTPVVTGDATPEVTPEMTPEAIHEAIPDAAPEAPLEATAATTPEVTPEATPHATAEPTPDPTLDATAEPTPDPTLEATAEPTPDTPPEQTAESTPEATAEATLHATPEATPEATPTATPEATVETKRTIVCFEPGTYTLTAAYGAALEELGLPAEVTALLSDGTIAQLAVTWTCVGDGLGGTAYIPEHENPLEAAYTFQAALADGSACPVALPTATVTYAMPQLMLMANGEVQTGMANTCPYEGFMGPLTWEMVEGEYLTIMVSSPNTLYLEGEDNRFSGMELTINVENGGRLIVKEDISCPFVINNYGRVSVMAGATATVNNVGQYSQISSSGNLTLTGGTCNGRVACEAGHLEAQGITFSDQAPCLITRDTANLDGSTFYAYLEICEGATVDGDFSMGSSTCQLAGTVNGTIHINSSELNTILNHTEVYHFTTGKLILHLRYDFESSDNCDTIGKILRYYRVHRGYSTHELAEMVGVVPATIILYENDKHPIKYKTAVLFAEVLGIDRKLLFDEYTAFVDYPCDVLLREARERLSLNQSQMAQEIGVARSAYSAWERATRTPRRQEYEKIAPLIKKS